MAGQQAAGPGFDSDLDFNFEPGLAARVARTSSAANCGLILRLQLLFLLPTPCDLQNEMARTRWPVASREDLCCLSA